MRAQFRRISHVALSRASPPFIAYGKPSTLTAGYARHDGPSHLGPRHHAEAREPLIHTLHPVERTETRPGKLWFDLVLAKPTCSAKFLSTASHEASALTTNGWNCGARFATMPELSEFSMQTTQTGRSSVRVLDWTYVAHSRRWFSPFWPSSSASRRAVARWSPPLPAGCASDCTCCLTPTSTAIPRSQPVIAIRVSTRTNHEEGM